MRNTTLTAFVIVLACSAGCTPSAPPGQPPGGDAPGGTGGAGGPGDPSSGGGGGDSTPSGVLTYYRDVLPVFQKSCLSCHGENGVSPPIGQAQVAKALAQKIAAAVMSRVMPPFPPEEGCNKYLNEYRLTPTEQQTIVLWAESGAAEGNPADAPPYDPPPSPVMGTPDKSLVGGPHTPTYASDAVDQYWCFILDPALQQPQDLVGLAFKPGSLDQVHHIILFRDEGGTRSQGQPTAGYECVGAPGEMLSGWVPGAEAFRLPPGVGMTMSPGDKLLMQVHYHKEPNQTPKPDQTGVDLFFAKTPVAEHAFVVWTGTPMFSIPAGAKGHEVSSTCTVNGNWKALGVAPHMHTLGRKFRQDLNISGKNQCMVSIPRWDFGWQNGYMLTEPAQLKSGDKITTVCTFDNPTSQTVRFGEATTEEMCFGFLYVVAPSRPRFNSLINLFGGEDAASICAN